MPTLGIIVASVREGRLGLPVAEWFTGLARAHGGFAVSLIDLKAVDLPLLREPKMPRLRQYTEPKTLAWSETVAAMDAFVFVTPEYNHGSPPALINALDHLFNEWNNKAMGFVSYGGVSGGLRSVQMTKPIVAALKMVPVCEAVAIPSAAQFLDAATGRFDGGERHAKAAAAMLDELLRWTAALAPLRG